MTDFATRASARLHLPAERVESALDVVEVRRALEARPVPPAPVRAAQRLLMKTGRLTYERHALGRVVAARRAVLGDAAAGPPRFLVRVDEFPHYLAYDQPHTYGLETAKRFHDIMASAEAAYLMAVVPQLTAEPLNPDGDGGRPLGTEELEQLATMASDGVVFGQHGTTHRTRRRNPRQHSELCGREPEDLSHHLDHGLALLAEAGIRPRVFVPPFNRFDAGQWPALAQRYAVVCGGPESVRLMGFHGSPLFRGQTVYLPAYPPFYATASEILNAVERLIEEAPGTWVPVVLHLGWEADEGWGSLTRLAARIAPYAEDWNAFLRAVDVSVSDLPPSLLP